MGRLSKCLKKEVPGSKTSWKSEATKPSAIIGDAGDEGRGLGISLGVLLLQEVHRGVQVCQKPLLFPFGLGCSRHFIGQPGHESVVVRALGGGTFRPAGRESTQSKSRRQLLEGEALDFQTPSKLS